MASNSATQFSRKQRKGSSWSEIAVMLPASSWHCLYCTEEEASQTYTFKSIWAMFFLIHVHSFPLSAADLAPMPIFQAIISAGFSTCSSANPLSLFNLS